MKNTTKITNSNHGDYFKNAMEELEEILMEMNN